MIANQMEYDILYPFRKIDCIGNGVFYNAKIIVGH